MSHYAGWVARKGDKVVHMATADGWDVEPVIDSPVPIGDPACNCWRCREKRAADRIEQLERDNAALREENDRLREAVERGEDWSRRQMIRAEIAEDKLGACASCGAAPEDQVISYIPVDQSETIDALRNDNAALREALKEARPFLESALHEAESRLDNENESEPYFMLTGLLAKIDALP